MTIYLLKDYPEYAATSLADAQDLLAALADPTTEANALAIGTIQDKLKPLTVSDTGEPLVISSIDDANGTVSSWVTDASTTLAVALGDPDTNGNGLYSSTLSFSIVGSTRTGTLALNTNLMQSAINRGRMCAGQGGLQPITLTLQILKTVNSATQTVGEIPIRVLPPVFNGTPQNVDAQTYVSYTGARAGYVLNLSGITSLTGGGATTLDGQDLGSLAFPLGCIAVTSDNVANVGFRMWKAVSGTLAATDLANLRIKPTNYSNSNPMYWQG